MRWLFCSLLLLMMLVSVGAQRKIQNAKTHKEVCFFSIDKEQFEEFMDLQRAIWKKDYRKALKACREMERVLKKFDPNQTNRSFELWYIANYIDFDEQVEVVKQATLKSLETYRKRLRLNTARYFDHRQFMVQYLAYKTEVFYPEYWFMSQERYFSYNAINRIKAANEEGYKIFEASEYHKAFEPIDELLAHEEDEMKHYLRIGEYGEDSSGIADKPMIPYSYLIFDREAAAYVLENFELDDATMDLDTDREVRALKRFLIKVKVDEIYLLLRFDTIPFGTRDHHQKARKKIKKGD
jgi:hypothetical protein